MLSQRNPNLRLVTHEKKAFDALVASRFEGRFDASNDDTTTVVAAHDVNSYSHKNSKSAERNTHPRSCGKAKLRTGLDRDHLTALVIAAGGAHPMGAIRSGTLRASAELRQFQHAVVSSTHALPAL